MAGGSRRPLGEAGKKAMKNKSRYHPLSGFGSAVHYRAAEVQFKNFSLCRPPVS
jgi:hypothetical protein